MTPSPQLPAAARADLRACLASIGDGDRAKAVAAARSVAASSDRAARFAGVRLLYLLRNYQEVLDSLQEQSGVDVYAQRMLYSLLKRLRFEQEADAALTALLRVSNDVRVHEAAMIHYQGMGRARTALSHLEEVIRAQPNAAHHYRTKLKLAADAGDLDAVLRAAERALQLDPERWLDVVDKLLEVGFFDVVEREANLRRETPEGRALLGQLALFRGASRDAAEHAASAFERDRRAERALTVLVGAAILGGDLERAARDLGGWSGELGPTLQTWRAELLFRRGDLEEAGRALTRVQNEVPDHLAAKLLWVLVKSDLDREEAATLTAYDGLLEGQLQAVGIEPRIADGRVDAGELRAAAAEALTRLAGNRSPFPSVVSGGQLRPLRVPASLRHRVREIQHTAPWVGLDHAMREIVDELARIGSHPIAECYEAELHLWAGDYDAARERFETILRRAPRTNWAWIGLGASRLLLGDPAQALATLDEGVKVMGWRGATLPVYRGEALFRLGRLDEAAGELREACQSQPSRVAAWILRVLVEDARGDAAARQEAFAHLNGAASALLSDAARAAGLDGWWPNPAPAATQLRVAAQALAMMRGNRASTCTFWFAPRSGAVRSVVYRRPVTTPAWEGEEKRALLALASKQ